MDDDPLDYIRRSYGVPARVGGRIRYTGSPSGRPVDGTIVGTRGQYLRVEFDAMPGPDPGHPDEYILHPTWEVEYLETEASQP